jgi:hypothetical protein
MTGPPASPPATTWGVVAHALRVKQVATVAELATLTSMTPETVDGHLAALANAGDASLRERHQLWQLTPLGTTRHDAWLADEAAQGPAVGLVRHAYVDFLPLNTALKEQCGKWQLRDGQPNDHGDTAYDESVIEGLKEIDGRTAGVLAAMSAALPRLGGYRPRLAAAFARVRQGESNAFTGVLCDSYHDIWMELHQDLIITLGIDRRAEGSV